MAIILIALAALQVHWTGQVSQADRERMQANLETAVLRFRRDFYLQLLRICWAFQSPADGLGEKTLKFYANRYDDWISASARPDMVAGIFVWTPKGDHPLRLDSIEGRFKPAPWPPELERLRRNLEQQTLASFATLPSDSPDQSWTLNEESHVLFHPFFESLVPGQQGAPALSGGILIDLNMAFIWHRLLPELIARYFRGPAGSDYRVSVISGNNPEKIFYQSSVSPSNESAVTGDIVENLVRGRGRDFAIHPAVQELQEEKNSAKEENSAAMGAEDPHFLPLRVRRKYLPLLAVAGGGNAWRLIVRHRSGSVEAAVNSLRRRNLIVSFSVLLLLAVSMALIVISAQRAQRLAKLQMDFMAGVSHELRTPLAVICSAAENLADGIIGAPEQVKNYGILIRDEGRRLSEMVGQVLAFAADQASRRMYRQRPLDIAEVIEAALARIQPAIESEQVVIEKHLDPGIPPVMGDPSSLGQCVQNLILNAVKYGGASRWVGVRTEKAQCESGDEVLLIVEDRGLGIDPDDLPHIFEPFYRGKNGGSGQVHGTGLGLSLARDITESMGGRLSVKTTPGRGSQFTLHLPALATTPHETQQEVS